MSGFDIKNLGNINGNPPPPPYLTEKTVKCTGILNQSNSLELKQKVFWLRNLEGISL